MNEMNGFAMLSGSYKHLIQKGKISKEAAEKEIRIYDFLATCDKSDFYRIVDSTALNDIIKAYVKLAITYADVNDKKTQEKILDQLRWIFDLMTSQEVYDESKHIL